MEQLVARRAHNPKVVGSSPAPATNKSRLILSGFFYLIEFRFCENWVLGMESGTNGVSRL
jgi:hypothetical protein